MMVNLCWLLSVYVQCSQLFQCDYKEDAMDRCKWRKMIKEARWSGWVWVGVCFFWYRPTRVVPDQRPLNGRCCCCRLFLVFSASKPLKLLLIPVSYRLHCQPFFQSCLHIHVHFNANNTQQAASNALKCTVQQHIAQLSLVTVMHNA